MFTTLTRPAVLGSLLAASVAGNLFLGGILAGRIGAYAMHPPMFERGFESRLRFVPEEQRREMRRHLRPALPAMREHHEKMQELRKALATELERAAPDRAVIEKQLADIRQQSALMQEALHKSFVDTVLKLSPAERKRIMDAMLEAGGPGGRGKPGGPGHGPGPGMGPPPEAMGPGAPMPPPPEAPQ